MVLSFNNLPLQRTSFIGRERETDEITRLLDESRLLTLTGAGGCGKTRLAVRAAAEAGNDSVDGAWLVELAAVADPGTVVTAVCAAVSVREPTGHSATAALIEFLRARRLLLVLDNCEHVVDAVARLVDAILAACPDVRILATSREPLGCVGETTWRVPSLSEAHAIALFIDRANAARPEAPIRPSDEAAIAEICRQLDGIPLAIELAAARVRVFSTQHIAARLDDRFRLLSGGPRTALPRQQTLLATVDWSYALLSDPERAVLRRLSVFARGWEFEAAEAVVVGDGVQPYAVLDLLAQLVNKSMVVAHERDGATRYYLLETIRQFAFELLTTANEVAATRDRHLRFYVELAEQSEPRMRGPETLETVERLEAEGDNIRAALDWGLKSDHELALRLAGALGWFWWSRSYHSEGRRWLGRVLQRNPEQTGARAKALYAAGWLAHHQRDLGEAEALFQESLQLGRRLADPWTIAWALHGLGRVAYFANDPASTRALATESLAHADRVGDPWLVSYSLHLLGIAAYMEGDDATARGFYDRSLAIRRTIGDGQGISLLLSLMGIVAVRQRQFAEAHVLFTEALGLRSLIGEWGISVNVATFAGLAGVQAHYVEAVKLAGASATLRQSWQTPLIPLIEAVVDEVLTKARTELAHETYAAAWSAGQAMSKDEAIAAAFAVRVGLPEARGAHGLSPTETQVLGLLAQGRTTREIAAELVIAISTADRHITHIYTKLGVRNRAEATAYALQHRLT